MPRIEKPARHNRPPRIRVPNKERAIFAVENQKFVGPSQRLSLTGGSALLSKGPIPNGTLGEMTLGTVFGKVNADIEFLHTGADGVPLAQAFRFLSMDDASSKRFRAAARPMQTAGFADEDAEKQTSLKQEDDTWSKMRKSIRQLSQALTSGRRANPKA